MPYDAGENTDMVYVTLFPSAVEGQDFTAPASPTVQFSSVPVICIPIGISADTTFEGPEDFTVTPYGSDFALLEPPSSAEEGQCVTGWTLDRGVAAGIVVVEIADRVFGLAGSTSSEGGSSLATGLPLDTGGTAVMELADRVVPSSPLGLVVTLSLFLLFFFLRFLSLGAAER